MIAAQPQVPFVQLPWQQSLSNKHPWPAARQPHVPMTQRFAQQSLSVMHCLSSATQPQLPMPHATPPQQSVEKKHPAPIGAQLHTPSLQSPSQHWPFDAHC